MFCRESCGLPYHAHNHYHTPMSRIGGGQNKRGGRGWKIFQDEISRGIRINGVVGSVGLLCSNPHKYKKSQVTSLEVKIFWDLVTYISFIISAAQQ